MDVKNRTTPTPQTLHRNRRLLIAGVLIVLPAAAVVPSLIGTGRGPAMLTVVDQMTTSTITDAAANERAVESIASAKRQTDHRPMFVGERSTIAESPEHLAHELKSSAVSSATDVDSTPRFNGRPVRPARTLAMLVTAYSPDERSCGESADGITASGYSVWTNAMKLVAADTDVLPFGTLISIPGYDDAKVVPVLDRGGAIKGNRLDVLFATHEQAEQWGIQSLEVTVWEYADGQPGDFVIAQR